MATSRCWRRHWPASAGRTIRLGRWCSGCRIRPIRRCRSCAGCRRRFPDCDIAVVVDADGARTEPQGGQSDQHAPGGEARRAGHRRFRCARGAGLAAAACRGAGSSRGGAGDDGLYRASGVRPLPPPPPARGGESCRDAPGRHADQPLLPPGALLARAMGRQDCLGATMALRRETLERIGGFAAAGGPSGRRQRARAAGAGARAAGRAGGHHPCDHCCGDLVCGRCGATSCAGRAPSATLVPVPFAASVLQYPLVWATAGRAAGPAARSGRWPGSPSPGAFARVIAARRSIGRSALPIRSPLWLLPVRELMSVAVMVASYAGRRSTGAAIPCKRRGSTRDDEDAVPASAVVRRVRRRRRLALPGAAGDPQLLVSDLAGAARRAGAGQQADRRTARGHRPRRGDARRRAITSCA